MWLTSAEEAEILLEASQSHKAKHDEISTRTSASRNNMRNNYSRQKRVTDESGNV